MLIDRTPQPMLLTCYPDHHLIEVPFVSSDWKTAADLVGEALAELQRPLPHHLVADQDASGREHLLHHPQAQGKLEVEPDRMADRFSWEAVSGVAGMTRGFHALTYALIQSPTR